MDIQEIIPDSLKTVDTHRLISQVGNRVTDGDCFWLNTVRFSPFKEGMPAQLQESVSKLLVHDFFFHFYTLSL